MKLMILDGNSVINRAFYGVRLLSTKDGQYTNAIFGFLNILEKMEKEEQPDALCVAFDLHGGTFRHKMYDGYKANRHGMPEELAQQMPVMKQVLQAMRIPIFACQGWEADDVIGTVGKACGQAGWDCVVVTGDRDSLQLIDDHVRVKLVVTKGGHTTATLYDHDTFFQEYGIEPRRMIDLKSLMGDSSDNIPGVAGVGPKTATNLLQKYGTLEGVYKNLSPDNMKGKLYEKLENGKNSAELSYDLATIRLDAPIDFSPEACLRQEPDRQALYDLFVRLEFVKLIDKYHLRQQAHALEPEQEEFADTVTVEEPETLAAAQRLLQVWEGLPQIAISLAEDLSCVAVDSDQKMTLLSEDRLGEDYEPVLSALFSGKISLVVHGSKELARKLLCRGLPTGHVVFDTEVAAYLLDSSRGKYPLHRLAVDYWHTVLPEEDSLDCPKPLARQAVLESEATAIGALHPILLDRLKQQQMDTLYFDVELPLCPVLARMEQAGVLVDRKALEAFDCMLKKRIACCQEAIYDYAGETFNINSTKKLGEILFDKLGLPAVKKTKTGYSTNVEVLEKLKGSHPIIAQIMDYRVLTKLQSTYADGLLKVIAPDGRIRTTLQNTVTATGRLSSTDPNLQNIPVRTELGSEIRKMFVARPGWVLVDADYSQIELRVLAHVAQDEHMQQAFASGVDFHTATAAQVFDLPVEEITPKLRRSAKAVNFGVVYGISEFSLAEDLGITRWEAKAYIDGYLNRYSGVRQYMQDVVEKAKETGYVATIYGRRRYLPDLRSSKYMVRTAAERMAMNTPIQGTAADIIKIAMLRVAKALAENHLQAQLVLQVHDELIVECPAEEAEQVRQLVAQEMEQAASLAVPLVAEAKTGKSWYEAK